MQISIKTDFSYTRVMARYTLLTLFSALGCSLMGYIFLPFAAAFYAAILIFENPAKRIVSFVLPIVIFAINFLLRGIYSLEAVAYLIVGLIIFLCVKRNKSKGETAFWIGVAIFLSVLISVLLLIFELSNSAGYTSVSKFFSEIYSEYKTAFLDAVTSLVREDADGVQLFAYNLYEAEMMFRELIMYLVPLFFLFSFVISGVTLKVFSRTIEKNTDENCEIYGWNFGTSNAIAYFFIALSFVSLIAGFDADVVSLVIFTLNTLFTAVFAYIGLKSLYYIIISRGKSRIFALVLIVIALALLSSFAFQLFSYFGVIINIVTNKVAHNKRNSI